MSLPLAITLGHAIWDFYLQQAGPSGPGGDPGRIGVAALCSECRPFILTQSTVDIEALKIELRGIVALDVSLGFVVDLVIGILFPHYGWSRLRDRGAWIPPRRGAGVVVAGPAQ